MRVIELNGVVSTPSLNGELNRISLNADMSATGGGGVTNYEVLTNKPKINGVTLMGNKTSSDLRIVSEGTTSYWAQNASYVPQKGEIVVYSDYETESGVSIAGIKVGDGSAYVVDLPFTDSKLKNRFEDHINDMVRHITSTERTAWNDKINVTLTDENLILTQGD